MMRGDEAPPLLIRPFDSLEEYEECVNFQEEVWGDGFSERIPAAMLIIANRIGGLAAGAFSPQGEMRGFVFGLTGLQDGKLVHWSDMLAVRNEMRDQGLGTRMKHYQRELLLSRGVERMFWTFDPLQSRNAYVNFRKLGIVSREYVRDMYGETGSPLHGGLGTDRLVATWPMDSERVKARMANEDLPPARDEWASLPWALKGEEGGELPVPGSPNLSLEDPSLLVSIPREIGVLMAGDPGLALQWRASTREVLQWYLAEGYEVTELLLDKELSHYLLTLTDDSKGVHEEDV
jgi:chorismate synthase